MERLFFKRSYSKVNIWIFLIVYLAFSLLGISLAQEENMYESEVGNLEVLFSNKKTVYKVFSTVKVERDQLVLLKVDVRKVKEVYIDQNYPEPVINRMEFENVPLNVFVKTMGTILGYNIIIDLSARDQLNEDISVFINRPKKAEEVFKEVLSAHNLSFYRKGAGEIVVSKAGTIRKEVGELSIVKNKRQITFSVVVVYEKDEGRKLKVKEVNLINKEEQPSKQKGFFVKKVFLEGVSLEVVIKAISKATGINFVIEPTVPLNIETNVNLEGMFSPEEVLNTVFDAYDIIAIPRGNAVVISNAYKVILDVSEMPEENFEKLIDIINRSVSSGARVIVDKSSGLIVIKDSRKNKEILDNLKNRLSRLIKSGVTAINIPLDQGKAIKTEAFFIKESYDAFDIKNFIESKLEGLEQSEVGISVSKEFNAVIVTAPRDLIEKIKTLIRPYTKSNTRNLKITKTFYVKFISAENFKELIEPLLSPEGEVFVLSSGLPPTTAYEKELRRINLKIEELEEKLKTERDKKVLELLQDQLRELRTRKDSIMQKLEQLKGIGLYGRGGAGATSSIATPSTEASLTLLSGDRINKSKRTAISVLNAVVVRDYAHVIERIRNAYKDIISEVPIQIKIEARIVEIDKEYLKTLGINWSVLLSNAKVPQSWSVFGGANPDVSGPTLTPTLLGEPNTGGILTLVYRNSFLNALNLRLSAFERIRKAKSLAKPVVLTLNGEPAIIESTIEYPVIQVTSNQTALTVSADYKTIPIKLLILPTLAPDGKIVLDISLIKTNIIDQISYDVGANIPQQFPIYSTKQIDTKVIVDDGDTVVIGGIVASDKLKTNSGVPGLQRIPLLGWLFKEAVDQVSDKELLIFITPTIISDM